MKLPNRTLLVVGFVGLSVFALLAALSSRESTFGADQLDETQQDAAAVQQAMQSNRALGAQNDQSLASLQIVTLNADEYHEEIAAIDRLVFENQPMDDARRASLESKLEDLARRVKATSNSRFIEMESVELQQLAGLVKRLPDPERQNHWMRIRNNLFDDRSWFARSASDLEPTPDSMEPVSAQAEPGVVRTVEEPTHSQPRLPPLTRNDLQGRWRVTELTGNGRPMPDPELSNATWTFDHDQLVIEGPGAAPSRYKFTKLSDERGDALRLEADAANAVSSERGWMIYEFGERELRVAFYDGLGVRPASFSPRAGKTEPMLVVAVLQREP
jgi:uncharacterized protein (TIGR03067 family)